MKNSLNKNQIERYSRQIVLKNVGVIGQKKISNSKVLIVGAGGLGCPIADYLSRAGVGTIGIGDFDKIKLGNPDESGRRKPEVQKNNQFEVKADMVIKALGFDPEDLPNLFGSKNLSITKWGTLKTNFDTMYMPLRLEITSK